MTDEAFCRLSPRFEKLYGSTGRPSVPPQRLLRALLLQVLDSVRTERLLMERLQYNMLFRCGSPNDRTNRDPSAGVTVNARISATC
jgi:hypothetical protein